MGQVGEELLPGEARQGQGQILTFGGTKCPLYTLRCKVREGSWAIPRVGQAASTTLSPSPHRAANLPSASNST